MNEPRQKRRHQGVMAEYWGLSVIAKRMGVSIPTLYGFHKKFGFLMYHRWPPRSRPPFVRWRWYTNDDLIQQWEIARCKVDRDQGGTGAQTE